MTTDGETYSVETDFEGEIVASASDDSEIDTEENEYTEPDTAAQEGCIDINSASIEELQEIDHIGPDRAQQLIDLRPFASVDAMTRIDGIAAGRLNDIKEQGLACVQ